MPITNDQTVRQLVNEYPAIIPVFQRFGIDFVASPRHADMLVVTGAVTRNLHPALLATYEATPDPELVVALGADACSGGIVHDSYATVGGTVTVSTNAAIPAGNELSFTVRDAGTTCRAAGPGPRRSPARG